MVPSADRRLQRAQVAETFAREQGGVVHRAQLRSRGIIGKDVAAEVRAGRWQLFNRHTVRVLSVPGELTGRWWWAVWESGTGAVLDGQSALLAAGLTGFEASATHVLLPRAANKSALDGVRTRRTRNMPALASTTGPPRVEPVAATLRAAETASSERQAALLICLPIQQRIVRPDDLLAAWREWPRRSRCPELGGVVADVCDGAHSLGELDFAAICREANVPAPSRQVVRVGDNGRAYLDAMWKDVNLAAEIDGSHHGLGLSPITDAIRTNDGVLRGEATLRYPLLALRLARREVGDQIACAYWSRRMAQRGPST
ncbi:hypothetical protein G9U51_16745 [Calidifontibacter sp. DB0510]|uniref:Uncharacterized protein n=1 Tax=Metallococcus carri TaxID=1656884 RepID=A0A967B8A0_9MICO|nr:hypothetical protein [Metallococcus carri]NHN57417.1 hypothetical protein [Metallococcus carri]NOP39187.1 hypothetical protein [Calidifontibacter sp. DB2511S]